MRLGQLLNEGSRPPFELSPNYMPYKVLVLHRIKRGTRFHNFTYAVQNMLAPYGLA